MPLVSVVIPTYNGEEFLPAAVQSVIDQTFTDWEIIIIDDGSQNDIGHLIPKSTKVKLFRRHHEGLCAARNFALLNSTGKYVAFLDADDLWLPTKLTEQVRVMEADSKIGLCYTDFQMVDVAGNHIGGGFKGGAQSYASLLKGCCICLSTVMLRKECLDEPLPFDPSYHIAADYDLWLRIARKWNLKYLDSCQGFYRRHEMQISRQYRSTFREVTLLLREHAKLARAHSDKLALQSARKGLAGARINYAYQAFDACRLSWRDKKLTEFALHLWSMLSISGSPHFVFTELLRKFFPSGEPGEVR